MIDGPFSELSKLAQLRDSFKADTERGMGLVAQTWRLQVIDGPGRMRKPDALRSQYAGLMGDVITYTEDERREIFTKFSGGLMLREGATTKNQMKYIRRAFHPKLTGENALWLEHFLGPISGHNPGIFTPEFLLYTAAHVDLGGNLPHEPFRPMTLKLQEYLANPETQRTLLNADGKLGLDTIIRAHAKFLGKEEELSEEPKIDAKVFVARKNR